MIDFATFELNWKPNQFLMAPDGLCQNARPHQQSPEFDLTADALMDRFREVALAEPRVRVLEDARKDHRMSFVARSKVFRFPDVIDVMTVPLENGGSTLAVYSRARIGIRDFGVNKQRVQRWIAALEA